MKIIYITFRKGATAIAKLSGISLAMLLGDISPKISTRTVMTTVDRVGPFAPPNNCVNSIVDNVVEAIFTILFPISIVESKRS